MKQDTVKRPYQICVRCIMDTTDPDIRFDSNGICGHCEDAETLLKKQVFTGSEAEQRLAQIVEDIRRHGQGKEYDCIIGLSGGVDSSYAAYKIREMGLRPLAVHLDNGWDSELAVANIERIVKKLDIDLITHVIDWEEFRDLQRAFFDANVIDIELLTDHAIAASIYHLAFQHGIRHFLIGYNTATESVMPASWFHGDKLDSWNIRSIHRKHGTIKNLRSFPLLSLWEYIRIVFLKQVETVPILNYLPYHKEEAIALLQEKLGWVDYGGKHYESRFTQFYQGYILPQKFRVDKRRAHLSSLIYSGQITREQALERTEQPAYPQEKIREDREFVIKKLGFTEEWFDQYLITPPRSHYEYASLYRVVQFLISIKRRLLKP